jgi:CBS domain-containing membrane protein
VPGRRGKEEITFSAIELTDRDIQEAMKSIPGYLDITPGDFKEIYCFAYGHAVERIARSVTAKKFMTREVIHVRPDTPVAQIAELMGTNEVSGVPVLNAAGRVVGVISDKDFLARMGTQSAKNFMMVIADCLGAKACIALSIRAKRAEDIMSSPAITVGEQTTFMEIASLLTEKGINRVPVVDGDGLLVGIVSRADVLKASHEATCKLFHGRD